MYNYYVGCYQNFDQIFYYQLNYSTAYSYLDVCLKLVDGNGDFIFSRSSSHKPDNSNYTVSPYSGLISMSNFQTSPESESIMLEKGSDSRSETEQIKKNEEENTRLKRKQQLIFIELIVIYISCNKYRSKALLSHIQQCPILLAEPNHCQERMKKYLPI